MRRAMMAASAIVGLRGASSQDCRLWVTAYVSPLIDSMTLKSSFYASISNWAKLAVTVVKRKQFQGGVDAARKGKSAKTWKEV
jgi:hypothetical protein